MKNKNWYYNRNLKPQGPLTLEEIRSLVRTGEIGPQDLICHELDGEWRPAMDCGIFERTLFPATQEFMPGQDFSVEEKEWVLLMPEKDSQNILQEGPYSLNDLRERLRARVISSQHYIWKNGLSGWSRIADRPEFTDLSS